MNRLRSFFIGILLLAIVVAGVFFVVLTYRADEQTHIESYIFQMDNNVQSLFLSSDILQIPIHYFLLWLLPVFFFLSASVPLLSVNPVGIYS